MICRNKILQEIVTDVKLETIWKNLKLMHQTMTFLNNKSGCILSVICIICMMMMLFLVNLTGKQY